MKLKVIYKNGVPFAVHNEKEYRFELEKADWNTSLEKEASDYADILTRIRKTSTGEWCYSQRGYIDGYKASQSKGCFTEEDMRKAYEEGYHLCAYNHRKALKNSDLEMSIMLEIAPMDKEEFIDSLKQPKKLVAIEVEAFPTRAELKSATPYFDKDGIRTVDVPLYPHISKSEEYPDGLLTIKQYYYEDI